MKVAFACVFMTTTFLLRFRTAAAAPKCASQLPFLANTSGLGDFSTIVLARGCFDTGAQFTAPHEITWTVTQTSDSDEFQIRMTPQGLVVPYVVEDRLLFGFGKNIPGTQGGVEVVIPTNYPVSFIGENEMGMNSRARILLDTQTSIDTYLSSETVTWVASSMGAVQLLVDSKYAALTLAAPSAVLLDIKGYDLQAQFKTELDKRPNIIVENNVTVLIEGNVDVPVVINGSTVSVCVPVVINGSTVSVRVNPCGCQNITVNGEPATSCTTTTDVVQIPDLGCVSNYGSAIVRCDAAGIGYGDFPPNNAAPSTTPSIATTSNGIAPLTSGFAAAVAGMTFGLLR